MEYQEILSRVRRALPESEFERVADEYADRFIPVGRPLRKEEQVVALFRYHLSCEEMDYNITVYDMRLDEQVHGSIEDLPHRFAEDSSVRCYVVG